MRRCAVRGLDGLGDARAVAALIAALKDDRPDIRCRAARALGKMGDARAIKPIEKLLDDWDEDVRSAAREALDMLRAEREGTP